MVGKTCDWNDVKVKKHARTYRCAYNTLERLGADDSTMLQYEKLEQEDLKVNEGVMEENRFGQRNDIVPWFWRLEGQNSDHNDAGMQECRCIISLRIQHQLCASPPY